MKPITQTRLYDPSGQQPPGNCFQACVASLLDLEIDDVPDEADDWRPGVSEQVSWRKFWKRFEQWLQQRHLGYLECRIDAAADLGTMLYVPFIGTGKSPRGNVDHAVILHYERKDDSTIGPVLLHDPHPSRAGLEGRLKTLGVFVRRT